MRHAAKTGNDAAKSKAATKASKSITTRPAAVRHVLTVGTAIDFTFRATVLRQRKPELGRWLAGRLPVLGPTYVKLGQFISSRQDIFGKEFAAAMECLRDDAPPIHADELREVLASRLKRGAFASIDEDPIASASIGQVHRAVLKDGRQVVVKVKRPGIEAMISDDMRFMRSILQGIAVVQGNGADAASFDQAQQALRDMEAYLMQEVDFAKEARNVARFASIYAANADVVVPSVHASLSNDAVVVMDYVESRSLASCRATPGLANRVMDVFVSQMVYKGVVHGDPHPGNIGLDRRGRLVIYDFGNVIEFSDLERQQMKEMIYQLLLGNNKAVIATMRKLGVEVLDERGLVAYIDMYRDYMRTIDITGIQNIHGPQAALPLRLTDKFVRLIRVYGMLEGTCKAIDSSFNYFDLLDNYIDELFFDEEFLRYKVVEDVQTLMGGMGGGAKGRGAQARRQGLGQTQGERQGQTLGERQGQTLGERQGQTQMFQGAVMLYLLLDHVM